MFPTCWGLFLSWERDKTGDIRVDPPPFPSSRERQADCSRVIPSRSGRRSAGSRTPAARQCAACSSPRPGRAPWRTGAEHAPPSGKSRWPLTAGVKADCGWRARGRRHHRALMRVWPEARTVVDWPERWYFCPVSRQRPIGTMPAYCRERYNSRWQQVKGWRQQWFAYSRTRTRESTGTS